MNYQCRCLMVLVLVFLILPAPSMAMQQVVDTQGRSLSLPETISRVICSGPGCLRLITYFQAQDLVVAVDDLETRKKSFDARPYSLANPQYKQLPVFGGFRGYDDPEKILGLDPLPQVIFKTYAGMGYDPVELQAKTGIPVVILDYGDLGAGRNRLFKSFELIGQVLNKQDRADELIAFFNRQIQELEARTAAGTDRTCFVGGIAFKGPHGFESTEPSYPPFEFVHARNIAATPNSPGSSLRQSNFSKEKLLMEDPDILFLDLSTLQMGEGHGGLFELRHDPVYKAMTAVKTGQVYGVLPYNSYTQNFGSILADAWYIGNVIYPDQFKDIDPKKKADEIYEFLVSAPVFTQMNALFKDMAFKPVSIGN